MNNARTFYHILANSIVASTTNIVVWFAITFWVYLETKSVLAMSIMAGIYIGIVALSGFFLGSVVDRFKKMTAMIISSALTLVFFVAAYLWYILTPAEVFHDASSPELWIYIALILLGSIAGNIRAIALSTVVTILYKEEDRAKANGLVGTANGIAFITGSVISGMIIGFFGMYVMLVAAIALIALVTIHLFFLTIPERDIVHTDEHNTSEIDIRGTVRIILLVPGLFGLIFFHAFNNFLGGVFMALMDAYGLELMSVQAWGTLFGVTSIGFMAGGIFVAKYGLGKNPLRSFFLATIVLWVVCIFFTIQASIILLAVGMFIWMALSPIVEAAEQTILQKTIPLERQGRVFGFAQSIEQAATPVTAFFIGPLAHYVFIPFMTTGAGVALIGDWFGVGVDRGIALVFIAAGITGLVITLLAMKTRSYRVLSRLYQ